MNQMNQPSFREMLRVFTQIGFLSFGGPAGQIALMHRELVDERKWIGDPQFLRALNLCHLLPGPEAQQLATYIGWRLHGAKGGIAAGLLFVIPGALVIFALSVLYAAAADASWFNALFLGIKAAVLAIVVQALQRIAKRALNTRFQAWLAVFSFVALFFFDMSFPLLILAAAITGVVVLTVRPEWLKVHGPASGLPPDRKPLAAATIGTLATWSIIWALPMLIIASSLGTEHVLFEIGAFFSKLAVVTFGGAYAVLAYMAQEAVNIHGWLTAREMADGLGLAETTPGPLIMVAQFVGFFGAYRSPEPFSPLVAGLLGSVVTTWVTFAPCFLWILTFAPWMDRLERLPQLQGALSAVTAAVVGVIANLALWFALHVLFARVSTTEFGPLSLQLPDWQSLDAKALLLAIAAFFLLFRTKIGVLLTLVACAAAGWALSLV